MTEEDLRVRVCVLEEKFTVVNHIEKDVRSIEKECASNSILIGNLEERQTKHAARHDGNYEKLDKKIDDNANKLDKKIDDNTEKIFGAMAKISQKLNENSGRDAVLKIIGGAFSGGVIVWVLKEWFT